MTPVQDGETKLFNCSCAKAIFQWLANSICQEALQCKCFGSASARQYDGQNLNADPISAIDHRRVFMMSSRRTHSDTNARTRPRMHSPHVSDQEKETREGVNLSVKSAE